jgi:hypothetical protein
VHDLPDFVNFNHSIHIKKGVGCVSCHGRVDEMPLMWREATLFMQWCIDCHRNPEPNLRPASEVFSMTSVNLSENDSAQLIAANHIHSETNCSICHY